MSTLDARVDDLDAHPDFELNYLVDDSDDPTEVTVFPGGNDGHLSTRWISIDVTHAVSLEEVR